MNRSVRGGHIEIDEPLKVFEELILVESSASQLEQIELSKFDDNFLVNTSQGWQKLN